MNSPKNFGANDHQLELGMVEDICNPNSLSYIMIASIKRHQGLAQCVKSLATKASDQVGSLEPS